MQGPVPCIRYSLQGVFLQNDRATRRPFAMHSVPHRAGHMRVHALTNQHFLEHMSTQLKYMGLVLFAILTITSCKKEDDDNVTPAAPVNEEELITTLRLTFTSAGGAEVKEFLFSDLDGDGGNAPVITADTLSHDSLYIVAIDVLNESVTPADTITAEIQEEDQEHQFFFQPSGANLSVAYGDADADGNPVGLLTTWTIGAVGNGAVLVTLRHEPDKTAAGVSNGDITNAGGETDIEVSFPVVIQ